MAGINIREVVSRDIPVAVHIITQSFETAAKEFSLTEENCPTNAAFLKEEWLQKDYDRGTKMFLLETDDIPVGFVAVWQAEQDMFKLEKLAVLPPYRHLGYGERLVSHVKQYVEEVGGKAIEIGIIEENVKLKKWYQKLGFVSQGIEQFSHLPFTVGYMKLSIK